MKKNLLLLFACLISLSGYAQIDEDGKDRVHIDYFSQPNNISHVLAEALRDKVIEGIQKMDHIVLIDVDSNEAMTTLGTQYLIQGNITTMQRRCRPKHILFRL